MQSHPTTQRTWILGDVKDEAPKSIHQSWSPRTPQTSYVSEQTEKFGKFLSLSDNARGRALIRQKKLAEADSARFSRRLSIFDSVKSVLLDSDDDLPPLAHLKGTELSPEIREQKIVQTNVNPVGRYSRRGSCTKYSLESEAMIRDVDNASYENPRCKAKPDSRDEHVQKGQTRFGIDASGKRLKNGFDGEFVSRTASPSKKSPVKYELTTIDQMPLPMKGGDSRSKRNPRSFPVRDFHSPISSQDGTNVCWSPQSCHTDPGLVSILQRRTTDIVGTCKPRRDVKHALKKDSKIPSDPIHDINGGQKIGFSRSFHDRETLNALPPAPFLHNASYDSVSPKEKGTLASQDPDEHRGSMPSDQEKSRGSAPKFGSLLKRLYLQRNDSGKSFGEESENGSRTADSVREETKRATRRTSITSGKLNHEIRPLSGSTRPLQWKVFSHGGSKQERDNTSNHSHHSHRSRRSPSPVLRRELDDPHSAPHVRKSWNRLKRQEVSDDAGASPVVMMSKVRASKLLPPQAPPLAFTRSPKTARPPRHQDMSGQINKITPIPL